MVLDDDDPNLPDDIVGIISPLVIFFPISMEGARLFVEIPFFPRYPFTP
jgi:hypothetical protein